VILGRVEGVGWTNLLSISTVHSQDNERTPKNVRLKHKDHQFKPNPHQNPNKCTIKLGTRSFRHKVRYKSKSIRYTCKVDSIQTHVTWSCFDTEYYTMEKWQNKDFDFRNDREPNGYAHPTIRPSLPPQWYVHYTLPPRNLKTYTAL